MELQTQQQDAILQQKREAWGQMGVAVHQMEMQLQVEAQGYLRPLEVIPTKVEDLPDAESRLKEAKSGFTKIQDKRKEITSKFDAVAARLMQPEKSFADPIKVYSDAIIGLKRIAEDARKKQEMMQHEKNSCDTYFKTKRISIISELSQRVTDLVAKAYNHALNESTPLDRIEEYQKKCIDSVTVKSFQYTLPTFPTVYMTPDEVESVKAKYFPINVMDYVMDYSKQMHYKFSDYSIAIQNKEAALALAHKQQQEEKEKAEQIAQQQRMAAKIESASFEPVIEPVDVKALKHTYVVDMDETMESFLAIMAAFSANLHLCKKFLKVNKWFAFTAAQAATALGKAKIEDNNFAPAGITFKMIDKL